MAATLAVTAAICFALAAALQGLTPPGWHVAFAALLAALTGAWLITMSNRETPMPGGQRGDTGVVDART